MGGGGRAPRSQRGVDPNQIKPDAGEELMLVCTSHTLLLLNTCPSYELTRTLLACTRSTAST